MLPRRCCPSPYARASEAREMTAQAIETDQSLEAPHGDSAPPSMRPNARDDCEPELNLWNAALQLLLEDATGYLRRGDDKHGMRRAAFHDVTNCGSMLRYVCSFARIDPDFARDMWMKRPDVCAQPEAGSTGRPTQR